MVVASGVEQMSWIWGWLSAYSSAMHVVVVFAENVHLPALYVDLLYTTPQALLASLAPGDRLAHVFSTLVMISKTCRVWKFVCKVKSTAKTL